MERSTLIAMSGGVDSTIAALIMKEKGFRCAGAYMMLHSDGGQDAEDARAAAESMGMPFYLFDFRADFEREVVSEFVKSYEKGDTPNPCVLCNKKFKFSRLIDEAQKLGYESVTTGHYARICTQDGVLVLKKAIHTEKDQSYVLYNLTPSQLERINFPLGDFPKAQIRAIAEAHGFASASKKDSQDICFVPDGDYASFIEKFTGKVYPEGDFISPDGHILGRHRGMIRYTIGQRKGLGLSLPEPGYVCAKDTDTNTVTVGRRSDLFSDYLEADEFNFCTLKKYAAQFTAKARTRYNSEEKPCMVFFESGRAKIVFSEPQRAITSGQSVVVYDGDTVVGGGIIRATRRD